MANTREAVIDWDARVQGRADDLTKETAYLDSPAERVSHLRAKMSYALLELEAVNRALESVEFV